MEYSYLIGFFYNLSLDFMAWVFLGFVIMAVQIGISVFIFDQKTTGFIKTIYILSYCLICMFFGGVLGFIAAALIYLITVAIYSDFSQDYE
jgi:hypothetical protein